MRGRRLWESQLDLSCTAVFSYKFLVNDYATSFKLKIHCQIEQQQKSPAPNQIIDFHLNVYYLQ